MQTPETLFLQYTKEKPVTIYLLNNSGSNRKYYRIISENFCLIGVEGTSVEENQAFITMSNHFREKGLPVPAVLSVSDDKLSYIQNDLGDTLLFDAISEGRKSGTFSETEKDLLLKTMRILAEIQVKGADGFDFSVCYPQPEFNKRSVMWDLNYFKYCFLKITGVDFQENNLEDDFEKMAEFLTGTESNAFMYRDFQSRNVMLHNGELFFIDFQGGRIGPLHYDVASFLWQAKANFSAALREELIKEYLGSLRQFMPVDVGDFKNKLRHFVLFRTLQVLGAYGFRGYVEHKPHFLESVPFAIMNLRELLKADFQKYPYLSKILTTMCESEQFKPGKKRENLKVVVYSFSYRKGIPEDNSGNGGGFVFDCRAIHNPGKYDEYKALTGRDRPVIDFLEKDAEITRFLEHCHELVDNSVERYIKRGFSDLLICFGCTGGQHRSVYSAQKTAEHLHEKFGVEVQLIHREQNIIQNFDQR